MPEPTKCSGCGKPLGGLSISILEEEDKDKLFHRECYEKWRLNPVAEETRDDYSRWYWWWQNRTRHKHP